MLQEAFSSTWRKGIVALYGKKVVGCAILDLQMNANEIRSKYEIEDYIIFGEYEESEHCLLHCLFLSPEFENKRKFFIKEIFRITRKYCMYYQSFNHSRIGLLSTELIKVQHRRKYSLDTFLNS